MTDKTLIAVVNALEGYRLQLERGCEKKNDVYLLQSLMIFTIGYAKEYKFPVEPYERWLTRYVRREVI